MRTLVTSLVVFAVLSCSVRAHADSCYSNSQCSAGYICWGGACQPGGSNGQTPSSSNGPTNWIVLGLGLVLIVGVIYWLRPQSTATARIARSLPPEAQSWTAPIAPQSHAQGLGLTLSF